MKIFTICSKSKKMLSDYQVTLSKLGVALFWLSLWQIISLLVGLELLIPSPATVFRRLLFLIKESAFYETVFYSIVRIMFGYILALFFAVILAVVTARFHFLYVLLAPLMGVIKATPVASFIIIALIWLKAGGVVTLSVFLMVLPMVWANLYQGIIHTDPQLLEMSRMFSFSIYKKVRWIYIPAVLPYFVSAVNTGLGFAWKAGVAAEVLGTPRRSIGHSLYNAKIYLETADLFAWTVVVILLSVLLEKVVIRMINHAVGNSRS